MRRVFVDTGGDTCPLKGSKEVVAALIRSVRRAGLEGEVEIIARGCFGLCKLAPNMYIEPEGIWYSRFTVRDVPAIVRSHLIQGKIIRRLVHYPQRPVQPKRTRRTPHGRKHPRKRN